MVSLPQTLALSRTSEDRSTGVPHPTYQLREPREEPETSTSGHTNIASFASALPPLSESVGEKPIASSTADKGSTGRSSGAGLSSCLPSHRDLVSPNVTVIADGARGSINGTDGSVHAEGDGQDFVESQECAFGVDPNSIECSDTTEKPAVCIPSIN